MATSDDHSLHPMNKDVEQYLDALSSERRSRLETLHQIIITSFPQATIDLKYKMPTYCVGEGWGAIANQKRYISLYTCGYHHIEPFKAKHPKIKTGKGCINFQDKDLLPLDDIKAVVDHAINHPKQISPK